MSTVELEIALTVPIVLGGITLALALIEYINRAAEALHTRVTRKPS